VALCDNEHQGIVPVSKELGDGANPNTNLYWGALYGLRTLLNNSPKWQKVRISKNQNKIILERLIFKYLSEDNCDVPVYLLAEAYRGEEIKCAVVDFLSYASRKSHNDSIEIADRKYISLDKADLFVYIGHNGLMDFDIAPIPLNAKSQSPEPEVIIMACYSQSYFESYVRALNAKPLLWTTGLCSPEAYTLLGALEGWIQKENPEQIRLRAVTEYAKYQRISLESAMRIWVTSDIGP
jgi:hypothetical protein